jgi:hypothetical protein
MVVVAGVDGLGVLMRFDWARKVGTVPRVEDRPEMCAQCRSIVSGDFSGAKIVPTFAGLQVWWDACETVGGGNWWTDSDT